MAYATEIVQRSVAITPVWRMSDRESTPGLGSAPNALDMLDSALATLAVVELVDMAEEAGGIGNCLGVADRHG